MSDISDILSKITPPGAGGGGGIDDILSKVTPIEADVSPATVDDGMGTLETFGRGVALETIGGTLGAIPAIAMIANGTYDTIRGLGPEDPEASFLETLGYNMMFDPDTGDARPSYELVQGAYNIGQDISGISYEDMSAGEELSAAVASAILPVGWLGKLGKVGNVATRVGNAASKLPKAVTVPARVAGRVAEATVIPGTLPTTKVNTAINATVAAGLTEYMREMTTQDSLTGNFMTGRDVSDVREGLASSDYSIHDTEGNMPDGGDDPDLAAAEVTGTVGAISGGVLVAGALGGRAARAVGSALPNGARRELARLEGALADDSAVIREQIRAVAGSEAADQWDASNRTRTRNAADNGMNHAHQSGELDIEGNYRAIPIDALRAVYNRMRTKDQQLYDATTHAYNRKAAIDEIGGIGALPKSLQAKYQPMYDALNTIIKQGEGNRNVKALMDATDQSLDKYGRYQFGKGIIDGAERTRQKGMRRFTPTQFVDADTSPSSVKDAVAAGDSPADAIAAKFQRRGAPEMVSSFLRGDKQPFRSDAPKLSDYDASKFVRKPKKNATAAERAEIRADNQRRLEGLDRVLDENFNRERKKTLDAFRDYSSDVLVTTRANESRRDFVDKTISNKPDAPVRKATEYEKANMKRNVIQIRRKGQTEDIFIADTKVATALRYRPYFAMPGLSGQKRLAQMFLTGNFNPFFTPFTLLNDAVFGMINGNVRYTVSGPVDAMLQKMLGEGDLANGVRAAAAFPVRVADLPLVVAEGIGVGAAGRWKAYKADLMQRKLAAAGMDDVELPWVRRAIMAGLDKFYGANFDHVKAYKESGYAQILRNGYLSNRIEADIDKIGLIARADQALNDSFYGQALNTVRDAYRVGFFLRNMSAKRVMKGSPLTQRDIDAVVRETREISADPSKAGDSALVSGLSSSVIYGNVILQSLARLSRSMANPATWSMFAGLGAIGILAEAKIQAEIGDEALQDYYRNTPDYERLRGIPMMMPDGTIGTMPLGPEGGVLANMMMSAIRSMWGQTHEMDEARDLGAKQMVLLGLGNLLSISAPPVVQATGTMIHGAPVDLGALVTGGDLTRPGLRGNRGTITEDYRGLGLNEGMMTDKMAFVLEHFTAAFGQSIAEGWERGLDEYDGLEEGFFPALTRVTTEAGTAWYNTQVRRRYPLLSEAVHRQSLATPVSGEHFEIDQALSKMKQLNTVHYYRVNGRLSRPHDPANSSLNMLPSQVDDPVLREMVTRVTQYFDHGPNKHIQTRIDRLKQQYDQLRNSTKGTYTEVNSEMKAISDQLNSYYKSMMYNYAQFETGMKQQYGDDWNIDDMVDALEKDLAGSD